MEGKRKNECVFKMSFRGFRYLNGPNRINKVLCLGFQLISFPIDAVVGNFFVLLLVYYCYYLYTI